ncbi:unnamed protein product [Orchesella dallaii]|uniref:Secreted protein n=1 Tax=Orchesella dallaii TaxID=48710 RepID=A0ABP1R1Q2_9HEXA
MLRFLVVVLALVVVGARDTESFPVGNVAKVEEPRSHQGPHPPKGPKLILNRSVDSSDDASIPDFGYAGEGDEQVRHKRDTGARDGNSASWNSIGYFLIQLLSPLPAPEKWVKEVRTAWGDDAADFFYDL